MIIISGSVFFLGVGFIICAIYLLVVYLKSINKIKIDAQVLEIKKSNIQYKTYNATIKLLYYPSIQESTVVLKSNATSKVGDIIRVTLDEKQVASEYYPSADIKNMLILVLVGMAFMLPGILLNV